MFEEHLSPQVLRREPDIQITHDEVGIVKLDGSVQKTRITKMFSFSGLRRVDETVGVPGDMLALAGIEGITIGKP